MRFFTDWHHGGLGRSLVLLFGDRLRHKVFAPGNDLCEIANAVIPGTWLPPNVAGNGGVPDECLNGVGEVHTVTKEQFMDTEWDAVIISRPESVPTFKMLLSQHPKGDKIRRIGQAGNENQIYDWGWIPNFLSSDYLSYLRAPRDINKIHYMQESGRQFQPERFTPLTYDSLKVVNTFINCLASFGDWNWNRDLPYWHDKCPHCEERTDSTGPHSNTINLWNELKNNLPDRRFMDYGINNSQGMISERELPQKILDGALTWGYKTYDGYGHSIAQSISMGRLCLVPRRFHKYRTASQFLIPNLTCLEADWSGQNCIEIIRWFTDSLERANIYSEACFNAAKGIFNWSKEAFRVGEFLSQLR